MGDRRMNIDLRDWDQREHAPRHGLLPDGREPLEEPSESLTDRIRAALTLQRYMRDVAKRETGK